MVVNRLVGLTWGICWMSEVARKNTFAYFENCSTRNFTVNVRYVYLLVDIELCRKPWRLFFTGSLMAITLCFMICLFQAQAGKRLLERFREFLLIFGLLSCLALLQFELNQLILSNQFESIRPWRPFQLNTWSWNIHADSVWNENGIFTIYLTT